MREVGQTRWQFYRHHQQNPLPCPNSMVLAGEKNKEEKTNRGKEEKKREEYAKLRTGRKRLSYRKIGLMTMAH